VQLVLPAQGVVVEAAAEEVRIPLHTQLPRALVREEHVQLIRAALVAAEVVEVVMVQVPLAAQFVSVSVMQTWQHQLAQLPSLPQPHLGQQLYPH
jgi:hypothetical protein